MSIVDVEERPLIVSEHSGVVTPNNDLSISAGSCIYTRPDGEPLVAVDEVSFAAEAGTFVSIVGPSGCGKTSLLMSLAGLQELSAGQASAGGERIEGPSLDRAVVFQKPGLLPWRSVQANVELGLEALGLSRSERRSRAKEQLEAVGLGGFLDAHPHQLSGGMQQRVGIARALAVKPKYLLLDEPFGALDAQTRERVGGVLLSLWEATRPTVVFITHSIDEAIVLSDRVLVMSYRPGKIIADIEVPLPRPRDKAARGSPEFSQCRQQIDDYLADEVARAEADQGLQPNQRVAQNSTETTTI